MKAILIDRASELLKKALEDAQEELKATSDPEIRKLEPRELVWRKIQAGQQGLHDPDNSGDMLILTMASWE
jgi:hypothetical protein